MDKQSGDETASFKEYPPSEIYTTSDPPPAYIKPRQTSTVQVARIAAYTLVAVSFILGSFILASSYVTATLSCQEYQPYPQEFIEDRLPRFQGLVAEQLDTQESKHIASADQKAPEPDQVPEQTSRAEQTDLSKEDAPEQKKEDKDDEEEDEEFKFKLPIHLDLDALTGALLEGNSKSKMNCVVEKQKSEEVLNKDQRDLITFGLDLGALDPGLKHITGERLAIVCETSREAPKESQPNQVVLPFPLPGFPIPQRVMPHGMVNQIPHGMVNQFPHGMVNQIPHGMVNQIPHGMINQIPHGMVNQIPHGMVNPMPHPMVNQMPHSMPVHLPFLRPNPFQNVRHQPQVTPRRGVEEIPIFVLEDESRLQTLGDAPRPTQHLQPNLQTILDLARGLMPALQNVVEIPDNKPFHAQPSMPEARHLPPWARPEEQEQVVQIQALPSMMRPPHPSRQIQMESRPFHVESAIQVEGRPMGPRPQLEQRPVQMEVRPLQMDRRPSMTEHRPVPMERNVEHPVHMEHRPVHMEPRPIHIDPRPVRMESVESRHPEGRSLSAEAQVLPVPSETVNPPPLPFDAPEPARPHFVQPRSIRSMDLEEMHRRDKRERR